MFVDLAYMHLLLSVRRTAYDICAVYFNECACAYMYACLTVEGVGCLPYFLFIRSEVEPDNPTHEPQGRRLFEGMLRALQDVSPCGRWL